MSALDLLANHGAACGDCEIDGDAHPFVAGLLRGLVNTDQYRINTLWYNEFDSDPWTGCDFPPGCDPNEWFLAKFMPGGGRRLAHCDRRLEEGYGECGGVAFFWRPDGATVAGAERAWTYVWFSELIIEDDPWAEWEDDDDENSEYRAVVTGRLAALERARVALAELDGSTVEHPQRSPH